MNSIYLGSDLVKGEFFISEFLKLFLVYQFQYLIQIIGKLDSRDFSEFLFFIFLGNRLEN